MNRNLKQSGYTLLELVMVLTIIAVLIVGIVAGLGLLRESRVQSVVDDVTRFRTSIAAFKLKYGQLPGDFDSAFAYFGTACDAQAANCNGNNDGYIEESVTNPNQNETFRVWQHLNLGDILLGDFSGIGLRTSPPYSGQLPASKYASSVYGFFYHTNIFSQAGNAILIGAANNTDYFHASVAVQDALDIDRKMDDGVANTGFIFGVNGTDFAANECSAAASDLNGGADYNVASNDITCRMIFWFDELSTTNLANQPTRVSTPG